MMMHAIRILAVMVVVHAAVAAPRDSLPLMFVRNHGQAHQDVRFMAKTSRLNAYFARRETVFAMGSASLRVRFVDATGPRRMEASGEASGQANFLIGPEETWRVGLPLLTGVAYRDLYPGLDLLYRNSDPKLKSEFIVAPGEDPARIRLKYEGAARLRV